MEQLLVAGLLATGWYENLHARAYCRNRGYREFFKGTQHQRAWVTKGGTLRIGYTCSHSMVVKGTLRDAVISAGNKALAVKGHEGIVVLES